MARYINAEHFDERVRLAVGIEGTNMTDDFKDGIQSTLMLLSTEPTADVVEVVHGEWEDKEVFETAVEYIEQWQSARCSACGKYHTTPYMYRFDYFNYCPSCGAKMEGRK